MTQGSPSRTRKNNGHPVRDEWDLDAILAEKRLDPVPVKLGGHTYQVRCNLRAKEIDAFWANLSRGAEGDVEAFAILLGDPDDDGVYDQAEAQRFVDTTRDLPREHEVLAVQRFVVAAKLRKQSDYDQGVESGE